MARKNELIAARLDVEGIRTHIGADTLGYLSLDGMVRATGLDEAHFCTACFTGDYPIPVQLELTKEVLEPAR
jgi:amidophosphoribosyltransferase